MFLIMRGNRAMEHNTVTEDKQLVMSCLSDGADVYKIGCLTEIKNISAEYKIEYGEKKCLST